MICREQLFLHFLTYFNHIHIKIVKIFQIILLHILIFLELIVVWVFEHYCLGFSPLLIKTALTALISRWIFPITQVGLLILVSEVRYVVEILVGISLFDGLELVVLPLTIDEAATRLILLITDSAHISELRIWIWLELPVEIVKERVLLKVFETPAEPLLTVPLKELQNETTQVLGCLTI